MIRTMRTITVCCIPIQHQTPMETSDKLSLMTPTKYSENIQNEYVIVG